MNLEKIQEQLFESTRSQNQLIFQEMLALSKLKNTWIAQIVTVSGTILSAVSVFSENKNFFTYLGLTILFVTILVGLIFIIHNLNRESNKMATMFTNFNDYNLRAIMLTELEIKEPNLTEEEKNQKSKFLIELKEIADRWDLLDENGSFKMLSENLIVQKVNIGNYILIFGLALGGLLITMAEVIYCNCG